MIGRRIHAITLAGAFAVAGISVAQSAHAAPYDGYWNVVIQTTNGHCGTTQWGLMIRGGRVSYAGNETVGGFPVGLGGRVSSSGVLRVNVVAGPRTAQGAGRLGRAQGGGRWAGRGPSGTCAGV